LNPDSAVAVDRKREAEPFHSKVDGLLPLSSYRSALVWWQVHLDSNEVPERKNDFEIAKSDAFAIPGFCLACGLIGLIVESGLKGRVQPRTVEFAVFREACALVFTHQPRW